MNCSNPQMPFADLTEQIQAAQTQGGQGQSLQGQAPAQLQGQSMYGDLLGQAGMAQQGTRQRTGTYQQQAGPFGTTGDLMPITPLTQPEAMTLTSLQFLNGALRQYIGKRVTINFLIGTNTQVDRTGTLLAVGANYIVINEIETDDILYCDFYTIKFVRIYR